MNRLSFSVDIKPKAKERPRFANGHAYTPKATKEYEQEIAWAARKVGARPLHYPCVVDITATFKAPMKRKSFYCSKRPDVDNLSKAVMDSLNGVAYMDDSQIVQLTMSKNYGNANRIEVEIEYLT